MNHDDVRNWNPPPVGSPERDKMPAEAFLGPNRTYPVMYENANGEYVESEKGLEAARTVSAMQHDRAVYEEATRRINKIREARGEELLTLDALDIDSDIVGAIVKNLCKNISDEAQAISDYTKSISKVKDKTTIDIFTEIRNDELGHLQKLTVGLTEVLGGSEPATAERMDGKKLKGDRRIIIDCWDQEGSLQSLLKYIRDNGKGGHSFSIIVDPHDTERKKEFGWDGDGTDQIYDIEVWQENEGESK